jgi:hypothetical protein
MNSHRGAVETVRTLWQKFGNDPDFEFYFVDNSGEAPTLGTIDLAAMLDYTEIGKKLHELLDAEYQAGRITRESYNRIRGGNGS